MRVKYLSIRSAELNPIFGANRRTQIVGDRWSEC